MPRVRVLGIDTSLSATGLCRVDLIDTSVVIATATVSAPPPARNGDRSKRAMARRVNALMAKVDAALTDGAGETLPDLVAVESLAYGAKGEGAWVLPWIFGRVIELCEHYDVPLIVVGTSQRAKYATGSGRAGKDEVMLSTAKLWPEAGVTNNNEADAMVVAAVGCHHLGHPICPVTKYRTDVMAKITD